MRILFKLIIIFVFLTFIPVYSIGQFTLRIEINNLKNSKGQILLSLSNEKEVIIKTITQPISENKCIIVIENMKSGKYSFKYFHDANNNKKLDTYWIGAPKEGYGFSNNAKGKFGPPDFEETLFELTKSTNLECTPTYITF